MSWLLIVDIMLFALATGVFAFHAASVVMTWRARRALSLTHGPDTSARVARLAEMVTFSQMASLSAGVTCILCGIGEVTSDGLGHMFWLPYAAVSLIAAAPGAWRLSSWQAERDRLAS